MMMIMAAVAVIESKFIYSSLYVHTLGLPAALFISYLQHISS